MVPRARIERTSCDFQSPTHPSMSPWHFLILDAYFRCVILAEWSLKKLLYAPLWRGRWGTIPQPRILETLALPIALLPNIKSWAEQESNLRFLWPATRWVTTLRQPILVFVCPKRQASFRFVSENMWYRRIPGRDGGIRTHTGWILSPLSLPLDYIPI